jgi:hypothetical protein
LSKKTQQKRDIAEIKQLKPSALRLSFLPGHFADFSVCLRKVENYLRKKEPETEEELPWGFLMTGLEAGLG